MKIIHKLILTICAAFLMIPVMASAEDVPVNNMVYWEEDSFLDTPRLDRLFSSDYWKEKTKNMEGILPYLGGVKYGDRSGFIVELQTCSKNPESEESYYSNFHIFVWDRMENDYVVPDIPYYDDDYWASRVDNFRVTNTGLSLTHAVL